MPLAHDLFLNSFDLLNFIDQTEDELHKLSTLSISLKNLDQVLAIGERLSSGLLDSFLKSQEIKSVNLDIRKVMITDNNFGKASPIIDLINKRAYEIIDPLLNDSIIITQGFIGSTENGNTTTLGRNGSDYSAALLADVLKAKSLEIYKDVLGIYENDPKLNPKAKLIEKLSFSEMLSISNLGSQILHISAINHCQSKKIPIRIKSFSSPLKKGTCIR